ncbi:MAG: prolyl oligopeptidase family serine peptidase [Longimicrobiales bacterium]
MRPTPFLKLPFKGAFFCLLLALGLSMPQSVVQGQASDPDRILSAEGYVTPPETISEAVLAPWYLNVSLTEPNADRSWFLEEVSGGPPPIATLAKPFHELGGLFVDFQANRHRNLTIRSNVGIKLISLDGEFRDIQVPDGARVSGAQWSPDGGRVAFFAHFNDRTHIYVADASSGRSQQLTRRPVLATAVTNFQWTDDSRFIGTVLMPEDRGGMPMEPPVPEGPEVTLTYEGKNLLRTYQSLIGTPWEKELAEWHLTGQLALIQADNRRTVNVGQPTIIQSFDFSPDGMYARVTRVTGDFHYVVPVSQVATTEEIWDREGNVLAAMKEDVPSLGVSDQDDEDDDEPEPRDMAWAPDGNGLTYLIQDPPPDTTGTAQAEAREEEEEGEGENDRRKDRVIRWVPPFDDDARTVLYEQNTRMAWHRFSPEMDILFAGERQGGNDHVFAVYLDDAEEKHTIFKHDPDDFYADPGSLMTARAGSGGGGFRRGGGAPGSSGATVQLSADGTSVFLQGTRYHEDFLEVGPFDFIDRVAIRGDEKTRIYEGDNDGVFENFLTAVDLEARRFVVSRESPTEVPQSYLREGDNLTRITENRNYAPDLVDAQRHTFMIRRPDGFEYRIQVTLPNDYRPGEARPAMFWFYPREYTGQEDYLESLRTYNKNSFPRFGTRSIEYLIREGYVIVQPDLPIVGPEMHYRNDNYVRDLRNSLAAVIDTISERGWVDRDRLGIGGHSYGAFGTANAMVNTPFFKAGIAGDGNYNRTLTPLSFQSERRIFWDAPHVYIDMSPFFRADDLTGALLMYHGLFDQNVGTFPIHSPRMFHALNGLGKDAAMYLYPWEDHGPAARETLLDLWARWVAWLDKWVKNPVPVGEYEG